MANTLAIDVAVVPRTFKSAQQAEDWLRNEAQAGYDVATMEVVVHETGGLMCCEIRDWDGSLVRRLGALYQCPPKEPV